MFANYLKEIYLDSDTKVGVHQRRAFGSPEDWFLTMRMKAQARADVNGIGQEQAHFSHAIFTRDRRLDGADRPCDQRSHPIR